MIDKNTDPPRRIRLSRWVRKDPAYPQLDPPAQGVTGVDLMIGVGILWGVDIVVGVAAIAAGGTSAEQVISPSVLLISALASSVAMFLVTWFLSCKKYKKTISEGFSFAPLTQRTFLLSLGLGITAGIAAAILIQRYSTGESVMAKLASTTVGLVAISVLAILVPPFEEMYYRGFIFPVLRRKIGVFLSVPTVALWFTLPHCFQLAGDWIGVPIILAMGLMLTTQRCFYNSLTPCIVSHLAYNIVLVVLTWVL